MSNVSSLDEFADLSVAKGDSLEWKARSQLAGWRDVWMVDGFNIKSSSPVAQLLLNHTVQDFLHAYLKQNFGQLCTKI